MQPKINLEKKDRGPKIGEYLFVSLVDQGALNEEQKNQVMAFTNVLYSANGDTIIIDEYCENLPIDMDESIKAIILGAGSIYKASYRFWTEGQPVAIQKARVAWLYADAIGGLVGGGIYGLDLWMNGGDFDWGDLAIHVIGGAAFTSLGKFL
jgi:hypothetical protein